ncbi:DUF374 domain-containing protein [Chlorobaculum thiosulfatiphilum]|uniref:DUF374 domain-containing protein n=1 Tax=Chlorobaculum thiosulfatiphilum TaxID=115852 RepID=A0A5C4S7Z2_CHLTI|nr:DUF374 domain-containing protein [Chlorobaculum thiosulfatiphilum]TNJ39640.1 DUF374 domain-containing protein [Chlorobaculum thiosulfatiphilum]
MAFVKHILLKSATRLLPHVLKLLFGTLKIDVEHTGERMPEDERGVMFAFWHGKMIAGWLLARRLFPGREISAVVSLSGDGQILSDALDRLRFRLIRGSSSRGKEVVKRNIGVALSNRGIVAVTPDGPRGPHHRFKYGTLRLAALHGAPVVFAKIRYDNARSLKSWDRFEIPMPFSRVKVTLRVVQVPEFPSEETFRAWADKLSGGFDDE